MEDCGHTPVWEGQRVERTNARGRHFYCEPFKTWIVEQALKPGMSTAGLAMRNQVNANQLRRWVSLRRKGLGATMPRLVPVNVTPESERLVAAIGPPMTCIEIDLPGAVVRIPNGMDAQTLRTVLDVLRDRRR